MTFQKVAFGEIDPPFADYLKDKNLEPRRPLRDSSFDHLYHFLRASWGNQASLYQKGEARFYLEKHSDRDEAWITEEFEDLGLSPEL